MISQFEKLEAKHFNLRSKKHFPTPPSRPLLDHWNAWLLSWSTPTHHFFSLSETTETAVFSKQKKCFQRIKSSSFYTPQLNKFSPWFQTMPTNQPSFPGGTTTERFRGEKPTTTHHHLGHRGTGLAGHTAVLEGPKPSVVGGICNAITLSGSVGWRWGVCAVGCQDVPHTKKNTCHERWSLFFFVV